MDTKQQLKRKKKQQLYTQQRKIPNIYVVYSSSKVVDLKIQEFAKVESFNFKLHYLIYFFL